jgi:hypothetical protein
MSEPMNATRAAGTRALRWAAPVAVLGLVLLASGCSRGSGSPGVAGAGSPSSSPSTSASPAGDNHAAQLAYARCTRAHGIADFPDPEPGGSVEIPRGDASSDLNPNNPLFQAADQACKYYLAGT